MKSIALWVKGEGGGEGGREEVIRQGWVMDGEGLSLTLRPKPHPL